MINTNIRKGQGEAKTTISAKKDAAPPPFRFEKGPIHRSIE